MADRLCAATGRAASPPQFAGQIAPRPRPGEQHLGDTRQPSHTGEEFRRQRLHYHQKTGSDRQIAMAAFLGWPATAFNVTGRG